MGLGGQLPNAATSVVVLLWLAIVLIAVLLGRGSATT
jgi:hypothetical protein